MVDCPQILFIIFFFECRTWTVNDEYMWPELCTALQSRASSFFFFYFILFSRGRYISLVLWLWLSCPIWDDSFLHLKYTRSDQMCDWNGINLCWERFSLLCWELFTVWYSSPGGNFFFFFLSFSFFPPFQAQSKRSIRSCDLKFPSFKVSGARRGWWGAFEGTIRYNFGVSCTFSPSERGNKLLPEYDSILEVTSSLFSLALSLCAWSDHKICPSLRSLTKKKNVPLLRLVKQRESGQKEGERWSWFWHKFSAVIMDPSHRMICSYTWLTELSSINKRSNTSTGRDTGGRFPLFSELRLQRAALLTCLALFFFFR